MTTEVFFKLYLRVLQNILGTKKKCDLTDLHEMSELSNKMTPTQYSWIFS